MLLLSVLLLMLVPYTHSGVETREALLFQRVCATFERGEVSNVSVDAVQQL